MNTPNSLKKMYYLDPQIYQLIFGNINIKKAEFINNLIIKYLPKKTLSVVDIGCGTGDILNALKATNRTLMGIDKSATMIKFAKEKFSGIGFQLGDMTHLDLKRDFDLALCMSSAFMYNLSNDQIHNSLKNFKNIVKQNGILVLDLVNFTAMLGNRSFKEVIMESYDLEKFKAEMTIKNTLLLEQQAIKSEWKWDIKDLNNSRHTSHVIKENTTFRMFFPKEIEWMLHEHGFKVVELFSNFKTEANNLEGHRMIVVARKQILVKK